MQELNPLYQAIRSLKPTQSEGFEGFVRDMFAEVTGQGFRLMKAGPQGGVDVLGDTSGTGLVVGIEGKHYAAGTKLPLDQLKSKIRDTAIQFTDVDLWVLAATRPFSQGDVKSLEDVGAREGIDILVLDWDEDSAEPPTLAVLCAMSPVAIKARLSNSIAINGAINWIQQHPSFPAASQRLSSRLRSPLVGYGAARSAMSQWLTSRMRNADSARLAFDSYATLLEHDLHRIRRPEVSEKLDQWWTAEHPNAGILLGDEGVGKTWAVLDWWLQKIAVDSQFPLTIVIPAKNISSGNVDIVIAEALFSSFGIRDENFWKQRVRRWLATDTKTQNLLVIVDGLNQNWMFKDWSEFTISMTGADRRGKAMLLLTARPDFYRSRLKGFQDLPVKPQEISLSPFDDAELSELLTTYGLCLNDFDARLLPLLRIPRLCHRAVRRRKELEDSSDITPERLVYEDWRNRQPSALKAMSEDGFKEFLANLARLIKTDLSKTEITRKVLLEELTLNSGDPISNYEGVLSEIIDGRWLVATGRQNQFKVLPEKLPYALGLALVEELSNLTSEQQARTVLDEAFDVFQGTDYSVQILRCASVFVMMESKVPEVVRQTLLSYWLEAQNFSVADFDTFWKCIGLSPESVLDVVERAWFDRRSRHGQDEVFVKAFANSFKWTSVATACEARLTKWFEEFWLDPLVGEVLGNLPDDDRAKTRKLETQQREGEWAKAAGSTMFGIAIRRVDSENRAWGCYRAIEMMSWLPRTPLLRPITAWAITRGIMGRFRQEEMFGWLLRWNNIDHDEAEEALRERACELASLGPIGQESGRVLLKALATRYCEAALVNLLPRLVQNESSNSYDPKPEDPANVASSEYVIHLKAVADLVTDDALRKEAVHTSVSEPTGLRLALARWAPESRLTLERRRVTLILQELAQTQRLTEEIKNMLLVLPQLFSLLRPANIQLWKDAARLARDLCWDWSWNLQLGAFFGESASTQIALLESAPRSGMPDAASGLLNTLDAKAACAVKMKLENSTSDDDVLFWLNYLDATAKNGEDLIGSGLIGLFSHPSVSVREKVFEIALRDESSELADALACTGWNWRQISSRGEKAFGSLLLVNSSFGSDGSLVDRVHPEMLGHLVEKFPDQPIYLSTFAQYVRSELHELCTAGSGTYPRALLNRHLGWGRLVDEKEGDLEQWLRPFLEKKSRRLVFGVAESFPLLECTEAISGRRPELAASLMTALLEDDAETIFHVGNLKSAALRLATKEAYEVQQLVLNDANTDDKLYAFSANLIKTDQQQKLLDQIDADLSMEMAGYVARGLTLAGFLRPSDEAEELWRNIPARTPSHGWLSEVRQVAFARYSQAKACFFWYDKFIEASSEEEAYIHFELFLATVDPRFLDAGVWRVRPPINWSYQRRIHWGINVDTINANSKKKFDEWKRVFLCTKPPLSNQYPTRR